MSKCEICGEPMPAGEEMFKYHGYSGNCPKPPLPRPAAEPSSEVAAERERCAKLCDELDNPENSDEYRAAARWAAARIRGA